MFAHGGAAPGGRGGFARALYRGHYLVRRKRCLNGPVASIACLTGVGVMFVQLSAEDCRERARECFGRAVAEPDDVRREQHLRDGEMWMARWRVWTSENAPLDHVSDETRAA